MDVGETLGHLSSYYGYYGFWGVIGEIMRFFFILLAYATPPTLVGIIIFLILKHVFKVKHMIKNAMISLVTGLVLTISLIILTVKTGSDWLIYLISSSFFFLGQFITLFFGMYLLLQYTFRVKNRVKNAVVSLITALGFLLWIDPLARYVFTAILALVIIIPYLYQKIKEVTQKR